MGLRFRRRVKLFPGVWLNVGKTGISTSIGGHGVTVNLNGERTRTTVGVPGTGLSYSETSHASAPKSSRAARSWLALAAVVLLAVFAVVVVASAITSP